MKKRIMIVDDEEEFAASLAERLTIRDYDVMTSSSGEDALEKLKGQILDVIILDLLMPGMGGVETLREIKKLYPLTEVIMLTGNASVESAIEGMKLGALDYLMKPCETDDLVAKISMATQKKEEQEERIREAKVKEIMSSPMSVLKK